MHIEGEGGTRGGKSASCVVTPSLIPLFHVYDGWLGGLAGCMAFWLVARR